MGKFEAKVVIVTGASGGIGAAIAIAFAKEGAKVVITGRNKERLEETGEQCKQAGCSEVLEVVCDLTDFPSLETLINKTINKFGSIDILINNAGYGQAYPVEQVELDKYEHLFQANLRAPVFLCKYALPHLKKTKGCVVNVSSTAGLHSSPFCVLYSMTKCALDHFTRGFAAECASFGVRVNSINPAVVETKFGEKLGLPKEVLEQFREGFIKSQPLGVIDPTEVADGILFLCSSPRITGTTLAIDGGILLPKA